MLWPVQTVKGRDSGCLAAPSLRVCWVFGAFAPLAERRPVFQAEAFCRTGRRISLSQPGLGGHGVPLEGQRGGDSGRRSMIHFKKPKGPPMPGPHQRANRARSHVRAQIEHVFAEQKSRMGLFVLTFGLARATAKIGLANLAYNMRRLIWLETLPTPACPRGHHLGTDPVVAPPPPAILTDRRSSRQASRRAERHREPIQPHRSSNRPAGSAEVLAALTETDETVNVRNAVNALALMRKPSIQDLAQTAAINGR